MAHNATELVVVRHGETAWNLLGKQQGQLDAELSETGVEQAERMAEALAQERFDHLYTSDLGRAARTAEIIARRLGLAVVTDARLRERHLGAMQGSTIEQFKEKHPQEYVRFRSGDVDYCLPGGESIRQRCERSVACIEELAGRHAGERLVIVTHGGILDCFFRRAAGLDMAAPRRFSLLNASINRFCIVDRRWRLISWGDTHHLRELRAIDDG